MTQDAGPPRAAEHAELQKEGVRAKLIKLAFWRTRSLPESEDLVQAALARVFDPEGQPWDRTGPTSFFAHVGSIVNGLALNARRSFHARREVVESSLARNDETVDGAPLADAALAEHEDRVRLQRRGRDLLALLEEDDPVAARVYRAGAEGAEGHAEQAKRAECEIEQVRYAYDRIKYHAQQILEREQRAELQRPRELPRAGKPRAIAPERKQTRQ
jgi:DNA-directed RNA polymerase specialized sigma24 family protein